MCDISSSLLSEYIFINSWPVYFSEIPGNFIYIKDTTNILRKDKGKDDNDKPIIAKDKNNNDIKIFLGGTPVVLLELTKNNDKLENNIFLKPLLKVEENKADKSYRGYRSGGRSAILCYDDKDNNKTIYYRLKGCGNYVNQNKFRFSFPGIHIRDFNVFGEVIGSEIRGCNFIQASLRELKLSNDIQEIINKEYNNPSSNIFDLSLEKMTIGNIPIGYWEYNIDIGILKHPDINITCSIFKTLGERRLSSHLIAGLNELLHFGILKFNNNDLKTKLLSRNNTSRSNDKKYPIETYAACCSGAEKANPLILINNSDIYLNIESEHLKNIPDKLQLSELLTKEWNYLYNELLSFYNNDNKNNFLCFSYLLWRLGREVGEFMNILLKNNIMWGYFFDYNPCEPHCNSHPNNFIILPNNINNNAFSQRFLSPVDFDMSYTLDEFINPYTNEKADKELFFEWKKAELNEMERALGGDCANDGLALEQEETSEKIVYPLSDDDYNIIKNAMSDTLLAACRSSYYNQEDEYPVSNYKQYYRVCVILIRMALIITNNIQS